MVSILDATLLQNLGGTVFPFLLIFAVTFGVLTLSGLFAEHKIVQAIIAAALAFMGALSPVVIRTVNLMAPWFVILILFLVLLLIAVMALGPTRTDVSSVLKSAKHEYIIWWIVFMVVIITVGSLATAISEIRSFRKLTEPGVNVQETEELTSTYQILVHPKVLGFMVLCLISIVTLYYLTKD